LPFRFGESLQEHARIERGIGRHRLRQHHAAPSQLPMRQHQLGSLTSALDASGDWLAAALDVEGGEFIGPVADDRHPVRFEDFEGARDVEDAFGAGADNGDGRAGQLGQVGGDVPGMAVAMGAADAAGGEQADAGQVGQRHGGGDGGGGGFLVRDRGGEIAPARLEHVLRLGQIAQFRLIQADGRYPLEHGDGCRRRPFGAHRRLGRQRRLQVERPREPMRDQRRFQRHHRPALGHCPRDLGTHCQLQWHGTLISCCRGDDRSMLRRTPGVDKAETTAGASRCQAKTTARRNLQDRTILQIVKYVP
jgi:hypothetical protein